ncbi:redoxin domain-containing protein [Halobaculum sp. MBLA0143]|uniref:redoxin domain-containing protein n=1 Tax=Halobaculum sp. MBLA0143 TaxID=3079933 RepID=UPI003526C099
MIRAGATAPEFEASLVTTEGELARTRLSEWTQEPPVVLAFFPAAFSGTCTDEVRAIQTDIERYADAGGTVLGVSTDLPWTLRAFAAEEGLSFPLVGDHDREAVRAFDVVDDFPDLGLSAVARRSVFVLDGDGTVTYAWAADDPDAEPPYEDVLAAVRGTQS